jgi:hypothetical protein
MENEELSNLSDLDKLSYELFLNHFKREYGNGEIGNIEPIKLKDYILVHQNSIYYEEAFLLLRCKKINFIRTKIK